MAGKTVKLIYTKSTKGTHVFGNEDLGLSLYLRKDMLKDDGTPMFPNPTAPNSIKMTLEVE